MNIRVFATIYECEFLTAEFDQSLYSITKNLGPDSFELDLSNILVTPECGFAPVITSYSLEPFQVPDGLILENLISFDKSKVTITVKEALDFSFIDKVVLAELVATTSEGLDLSVQI